ncbi:hypothetical protein JZ751_021491 [Albula glossodonta]|uniref:Scaffolding anchor of CK1 domain-containing protein n=1 Tax=Albula glossodonta TaxID=121402 RepID=A0A8T2NS61_9TELE|nr:hypothetical protein JZ751_021491 [Albula glossodonta]
MAESQILCMDDEHVNEKIPESKPEFYYSEEQRAAVEQLLKNGDGAFKMRLKEDKIKDFLSAREVKLIRETFREYDTDSDSGKSKSGKKGESKADSGIHSTYWPELSDTEVPPLDIGWPNSAPPQQDTIAIGPLNKAPNPTLSPGFVAYQLKRPIKVPCLIDMTFHDRANTEPMPRGHKRNRKAGAHTGADSKNLPVQSVARNKQSIPPPRLKAQHGRDSTARLREQHNDLVSARIVVALVTDLLTDLQILQDLLDAASKRSVPVYIVMDARGIPHFLDMCSRLQVGALQLRVSERFYPPRNVRVRTLEGAGLALSQGRLPGSLCTKYMLVDGDKVMFGSYRSDSCHAPLPSSQTPPLHVDLYKEFHITKPPKPVPSFSTASQRPAAAISTSRFQVALGDSRQVRVPAHKYHNPKYSLVVGNNVGAMGSVPELPSRRGSQGGESAFNVMDRFLQSSGGSERLDELGPLPTISVPEDEGKGSKKATGKKQRSSFRLFLKGKSSKESAALEGMATPPNSSPTRRTPEVAAGGLDGSFEVLVSDKPSPPKGKGKKMLKTHQRSVSLQTVNARDDENGERESERTTEKSRERERDRDGAKKQRKGQPDQTVTE